MEQSTWTTFTGLESLKQLHSYGLDVTFSTGVWAVVQVYLQLLLIRDEAGFVQTFPLAVGNPSSVGAGEQGSAEVSAAASREREQFP